MKMKIAEVIDMQELAVKRLTKNSGQGDQATSRTKFL
ncbi:hypothetical protein C5167_029923 [Papaver somniferum]|nr:hypothetical protein C5167_029923 [Papaver somniferum]